MSLRALGHWVSSADAGVALRSDSSSVVLFHGEEQAARSQDRLDKAVQILLPSLSFSVWF